MIARKVIKLSQKVIPGTTKSLFQKNIGEILLLKQMRSTHL